MIVATPGVTLDSLWGIEVIGWNTLGSSVGIGESGGNDVVDGMEVPKSDTWCISWFWVMVII